jgi:ABC-type Fe3+ transport system permease subunit
MTTITISYPDKARRTAITQEPSWVRRTLIGLALIFLTLFLFIPLISVFYEALKKGVDVYFAAITEADARGNPAHLDRCGDCRTAQSDFWRCGSLGNRQI